MVGKPREGGNDWSEPHDCVDSARPVTCMVPLDARNLTNTPPGSHFGIERGARVNGMGCDGKGRAAAA